MKGLRVVFIIVMLVASIASCGGSATPEPDTPAGGQTGMGTGSDPELGDPDAPPSVPCETSDDCAEGQICVDDGCAIPVPAGFY